MARANKSAITRRQAIRALEAKRDQLILKKAAAHDELSKTRDLLKRERAK
jgi:hypothetical protein